MSDKSAIEWTDATWNPVRGCVKVSPGCANCYAETFAERFRGVPGHSYEQGFDLRLVPEKLTEPLRWKKPRRVFVNSMSDLFQDGVSDEYIDEVFAVMALAPRHTFQVLTKRADRMRAYLNTAGVASRIAERAQALCGFDGSKYDVHAAAHASPNRLVLPSSDVFWQGGCNPPDQPYRERWIIKTWPLLNVWLGVSVENQHFADERIPVLLQTPAAVRFISAEPLLGPVNLWRFITAVQDGGCDPWASTLNWVIVGGESGRGARPFHVEWARSIVEQCQSANVPVFVKQLGGLPVMDERTWRQTVADGPTPLLSASKSRKAPLGTVALVKSRKGGIFEELPLELRVREFPHAG